MGRRDAPADRRASVGAAPTTRLVRAIDEDRPAAGPGRSLEGASCCDQHQEHHGPEGDDQHGRPLPAVGSHASVTPATASGQADRCQRTSAVRRLACRGLEPATGRRWLRRVEMTTICGRGRGPAGQGSPNRCWDVGSSETGRPLLLSRLVQSSRTCTRAASCHGRLAARSRCARPSGFFLFGGDDRATSVRAARRARSTTRAIAQQYFRPGARSPARPLDATPRIVFST